MGSTSPEAETALGTTSHSTISNTVARRDRAPIIHVAYGPEQAIKNVAIHGRGTAIAPLSPQAKRTHDQSPHAPTKRPRLESPASWPLPVTSHGDKPASRRPSKASLRFAAPRSPTPPSNRGHLLTDRHGAPRSPIRVSSSPTQCAAVLPVNGPAASIPVPDRHSTPETMADQENAAMASTNQQNLHFFLEYDHYLPRELLGREQNQHGKLLRNNVLAWSHATGLQDGSLKRRQEIFQREYSDARADLEQSVLDHQHIDTQIEHLHAEIERLRNSRHRLQRRIRQRGSALVSRVTDQPMHLVIRGARGLIEHLHEAGDVKAARSLGNMIGKWLRRNQHTLVQPIDLEDVAGYATLVSRKRDTVATIRVLEGSTEAAPLSDDSGLTDLEFV